MNIDRIWQRLVCILSYFIIIIISKTLIVSFVLQPSADHPIDSLKDELKQDFSKDENEVRGNWPGKMDFTIACCVSTIGLGNIWKFPYLCSEHGGGPFLVAVAILILFFGVPMFLLEMSIGQYTSQGVMSCWEYAPFLNGKDKIV